MWANIFIIIILAIYQVKSLNWLSDQIKLKGWLDFYLGIN
jgi:hypothetical protein